MFPQGMDQSTVNAKIATLTGGRPLTLQGNQDTGYSVAVSDINAALPKLAQQIDAEQALEMDKAKTQALSAAAEDGHISDKEMARIDSTGGDERTHVSFESADSKMAVNPRHRSLKMGGKNEIHISTKEQKKRMDLYALRVYQSGQDTSKPPESAPRQHEAAITNNSLDLGAEQAATADVQKQKDTDRSQITVAAPVGKQQARANLIIPTLGLNLSPAPPSMS